VHIGVGAFHRAHQAMALDRLLAQGLAEDFAICGVGLLPQDEQIAHVLQNQDYLYTLMLKQPDGSREAQVIGSIVDFLLAPQDPEAVIVRMSRPETRIVSLTVTEGGYNVDPTTGAFLGEDPICGSVGMGHTRWATHGEPSDANSHPHMDFRGRVAVVHNGIIDNYNDLKTELIAQGVTFSSETDTEVIANLIGVMYEGDLPTAVRLATRRLHGSYSICVMALDQPRMMVGARQQLPLVVGYGGYVGIPSTYRDAVAFAILIIVLLVRPAGLLGSNVQEKV
jgi:hypothetical protein